MGVCTLNNTKMILKKKEKKEKKKKKKKRYKDSILRLLYTPGD